MLEGTGPFQGMGRRESSAELGRIGGVTMNDSTNKPAVEAMAKRVEHGGQVVVFSYAPRAPAGRPHESERLRALRSLALRG